MSPPLVQVICSKGGVGKTLVCISVMHVLLKRQKHVFLIETDTTNPDVSQAHEGREVALEHIDLSLRTGWAALANCLNEHRNAWVVLNGRAASQEVMLEYSRHFWMAAQRAERPVITLWVINRNNDAVVLLDEYLRAVPEGARHTVCVVKNLYYSEDRQFPAYAGSEVRKRIERQGGTEIEFPVMAQRNAAYLYDEKYTIDEALEKADFGDRIDLEFWVEDMTTVLEPVLNG